MACKAFYYIKDSVTIEINENLLSDTVKDVIRGLLYRAIEVNFVAVKELVIRTKNAPKTDVPTVSEEGIYIGGESEKEVIDALFRMLIKAEPIEFNEKEKIVGIPTGEYTVNTVAGMRILHLCIFPETDYISLKKTVRFAGILGYTHVVVESWGGMEFKCLKELGWKGFTFTKAQIDDIIREIRAFKMEPIPMVNCLGHASLSRVDIGKHVVLDQNLLLSDYFLKYGWVWNFKKQKVKDLLKEMRREMCEICGEGEYFHIGLDETYYNPGSEEEKDKIYEYITELCEVVKAEGRTPSLFMNGANNIITNMFPLHVGKQYNSGMLAGLLNGACYVGSTLSQYLIALIAIAGDWTAVINVFFWLCIGITAFSAVMLLIRILFTRKVK